MEIYANLNNNKFIIEDFSTEEENAIVKIWRDEVKGEDLWEILGYDHICYIGKNSYIRAGIDTINNTIEFDYIKLHPDDLTENEIKLLQAFQKTEVFKILRRLFKKYTEMQGGEQ